jgi:biotin operon repressor
LARRRELLQKILHLLDKEPLSFGEICSRTKKSENGIWKALNIAKSEDLIEIDSLKKYHLTSLGKSMIGLAEQAVDSISFEVEPYVIDYLDQWDRPPRAKCTLIVKDANRIRQKDLETADGSYELKDGLVSPINSTRMEIALARVVDSVLDARAKDLGLYSILDLEHRRNLESFNLPHQFPGHDRMKRLTQLPGIDFKILIEFDGKSWVRKQNLEDLEKVYMMDMQFYQNMIKRVRSRPLERRQREAFQSLVRNFNNIDQRSWKELEDHRFFRSKEELDEFIMKEIMVYLPEGKNTGKKLLQSLRRSGVIEYDERKFYRAKVNRGKIGEFLKILKSELESANISKDE